MQCPTQARADIVLKIELDWIQTATLQQSESTELQQLPKSDIVLFHKPKIAKGTHFEGNAFHFCVIQFEMLNVDVNNSFFEKSPRKFEYFFIFLTWERSFEEGDTGNWSVFPIQLCKSKAVPTQPEMAFFNSCRFRLAFSKKLELVRTTLSSGQSYKHFTLPTYDSRVVLTRKQPKLQLWCRNLRALNVLIGLTTFTPHACTSKSYQVDCQCSMHVTKQG